MLISIFSRSVMVGFSHQIMDKGSIGQIRTNENRTLVLKSYENPKNASYEIEDLSLISSIVDCPTILFQGETSFVMTYHEQQKVNFKTLEKVLNILHSKKNSMYGYHRESFYGKRLFSNEWSNDWWSFFLLTRWSVLIDDYQKREDTTMVRLLNFVSEYFPSFGQSDHPSLVHGDMWPNNVLYNERCLLIDPVCFYGDPLLDFARFGNKYSSNIRTKLYKAYYALDRDIFLNKTEDSPNRLKNVIEWIIQNCDIRGSIYTLLSGPIPEEKIGVIYFGCFNPPHFNHLSMIQRVETFLQRKILGIWCPAPDNHVRNKMIRKGSYHLPLIEREKLIGRTIMTYVCDHSTTLQLLEKLFPTTRWHIVLGSDTVNVALRLIPRKYPLIIVKRVGHSFVEVTDRSVIEIDDYEEEMSSTTLRLG